MAEVVIEFENVIHGSDGRDYNARVCGAGREDGKWEGWIEFVASDHEIRTGRETTQASRDLLRYWATGLTSGYLDGALLRVLRGAAVPRQARPTGTPAAGRPATRRTPVLHAPAAPPGSLWHPSAPAPSHPVLDPFAVYGEGEDILEQQLTTLSEGQLRTIVRAYGLEVDARLTLGTMGRTELADHILAEVKGRAGR